MSDYNSHVRKTAERAMKGEKPVKLKEIRNKKIPNRTDKIKCMRCLRVLHDDEQVYDAYPDETLFSVICTKCVDEVKRKLN